MAKKVKKICFVVPRAYYLFNTKAKGIKDKVGGAQKQAFLLSTELAKNANFDVHFCVADFGQAEKEKHQNVLVWKSFNFDDFIFTKIKILLKTIQKINADVYIFRAADTGIALATLFIKIFLKKKVFYMLASNAETNFGELKKMSGLLTAFTMPLTYKYADKITAQTEEQYSLFVRYRKRKPDALIRNIIPAFEQVAIEKKHILWVGRLDKIKLPELFLELARKNPQEKFVMIAPIVRDFIEYGKQLIAESKTIKNLELVGFVKPNEIGRFYKQAKIYVMSSESEGFSNTMAEAMSHACPILSYKVNSDNIFEKYEIGLCAYGDVDKFYTDFQQLNSKVELMQKFGLNGLNYIKENHRKDVIMKKFIEIFQ